MSYNPEDYCTMVIVPNQFFPADENASRDDEHAFPCEMCGKVAIVPENYVFKTVGNPSWDKVHAYCEDCLKEKFPEVYENEYEPMENKYEFSEEKKEDETDKPEDLSVSENPKEVINEALGS